MVQYCCSLIYAFGIFRYLPPDVMLESSFKQLVGGVIWLVRDGINYVDVSKNVEWSASQENGTQLTTFSVL